MKTLWLLWYKRISGLQKELGVLSADYYYYYLMNRMISTRSRPMLYYQDLDYYLLANTAVLI